MASIVYGGLDVHTRTIAYCLVNEETGELLEDEIRNDRETVLRAARRWRKLGEVRVCYEASGAGYVLWRWLAGSGVACAVIAPSLIPKRPGDRIKTDRRDARQLAMLYRAGLLTPVRVPDTTEEDERALLRLRESLTRDIVRTKNRVLKYVRTLGFRYDGKSTWTKTHRLWLTRLSVTPVQATILRISLEELAGLEERQGRIDRQIAVLAQSERYRDGVARLQCLRGIQLYSAMVLLTEIGDCRRFGTATGLMGYLGVVPSLDNTGERHRPGAITKTGNRHARRILGEAAWHQMGRPGECARVKRQRATQPAGVVAIGTKAEERLYAKFWSVAKRKGRQTAVTAVARELAGFVWAILTVEEVA